MAAAEHYDSLRVASLRERASGAAYLLKKLHNDFKRSLIHEFARGAGFLVDVGCGRGGDLHKWQGAGVRSVLGVDVSGVQVAEARRRAVGIGGMRVEFSVTSPDLAALNELQAGSADVVTVMFALNYMWGSEDEAATVLRQCRRVLRPGGLLLGVYADGGRVQKLASIAPDTEAYDLALHFTGEALPFGSGYTLVIRDTVLDGARPAPEFVVMPDVLAWFARNHGFDAVRAGFRHVDASVLPSPGLRAVSSINASFVFRRSEGVPVFGAPEVQEQEQGHAGQAGDAFGVE